MLIRLAFFSSFWLIYPVFCIKINMLIYAYYGLTASRRLKTVTTRVPRTGGTGGTSTCYASKIVSEMKCGNSYI